MNRILIDLPEVIKTPRLILQMPKAGFGEKLHQAMLDGYDDYVQWLNWSKTAPTSQTVEEECRKHHADFILRDFIRYIIIEKTSDKVIGRCAFPSFQAHWLIPQFGISYFIRQSKRKNGYATETAHAMTLLAFQILKARKVEIYCDTDNVSSWRVPEKLNFELEYTQKGGWPRQGMKLAVLRTYSLFAENRLPDFEITW